MKDEMLNLKKACEKEGIDIKDAIQAYINGLIELEYTTPDGKSYPLKKSDAEKFLKDINTTFEHKEVLNAMEYHTLRYLIS